MSMAEIIQPASIVLMLISLLWVLIDFFKDPGGSGVWMPSNKCTAFLAFSLFALLASHGYTGNLSMGFWGLVISLVLCLALLVASIIGDKKQQKGDEEEYKEHNMSNTPSLEIAIKKFAVGEEWEDAKLSREGLLDLLEFPEALQELMADPAIRAIGDKSAAKAIGFDVDLQKFIRNPTFKALYIEKREAEIAGTVEELMQRWEADILPYIRCREK